MLPLSFPREMPTLPIGILYRNPDAPCYDDMSSVGLEMSVEEKLAGMNQALDHFAI